ncbi:MAG: hypothetical protein E7656_07100 [Ruminococcaceae bacterium]|nr:hypothetical protein [Oscillospiraceae bacterium]
MWPHAPKAEKQTALTALTCRGISEKTPVSADSFIIALLLYNNLPKNARGNLKSAGVDLKSAETLGFKTVVASGLPGKYTPVTAGEILFECIKQELYERGFDI